MSGVDLWWIPLGAGGRFVRFNGRIYEAFIARREGRASAPLYHSALTVHVPEGRFVIENAWPIPDRNGSARGVVVEGPVFSRRLSWARALRYEVRRWRNGTIFDAAWAVASPQRVTADERHARRLIELVPAVPPRVWGRDELGTGEMWNSNSVVAWLLERAGIDAAGLRPPSGGRAPGWRAGIEAARRDAVEPAAQPRDSGRRAIPVERSSVP